MQILVASQNPVKINATKIAFETVFPDETFDVSGINVDSGVPDQPIGDAQTRTGARNRVQSVRDAGHEADYFVGLEGGITELGDGFHTIAVMHVCDRHGTVGEASTATFALPPEICRMIRSGMELGDASAAFFEQTNSKQKNGAIGLLTNDVITRTDYYTHALILALVPFKNPHLYH